MRRIDQSQDTYFDDLQAKDAAIQATVEATRAGQLAKNLGTGEYHQHSVHHHHHTPTGTTTVTKTDTTPIGTSISKAPEPDVTVIR